jgi:Ca2+-binding RTX toxin-like protein
VADGLGAFSVSATTGLSDGGHALTAVCVDENGLAGSASSALQLTIDTQACDVEVSDFAVVKTGRTVGVSLSGSAQDGVAAPVSVAIFRDGALINTVTTSNGAWSYSDAKVSNAVHKYTLQGLDAAGNLGVSPGTLIVGTSGADRIVAGSGDDTIYGAAGSDILSGGSGNDTFIWRTASEAPIAVLSKGKLVSTETITDFNHGDTLDLSALGHLTFGGQSQSVSAFQVDWYVSNGNTYVIADLNGDSRADFMIMLSGVHSLTAADFLLG